MLSAVFLFISFTSFTFADETLRISQKIAEAEKWVEEKKEDYHTTAFELSMYYQGFTDEIIWTFDAEDEYYTPLRTYNEVPRGVDLTRNITARDAKKAFEYAKIADEFGGVLVLKESNLANLYLNGIGVEKDVNKALECLNKAGASYEHSKILLSDRGLEYPSIIYAPLVAYLYYKGIGINKDIDKCNAILEKYGKNAWRNFYTGYLVPKDFDFAIYCLELRKEFWAAAILVKIYSGEYLSEHANKKKAEYWSKIYKERLPIFLEEKKEHYKNEIAELKNKEYVMSVIDLVFLYGVKTFYFSEDWLYKDIPFENPFFDLEKSIELLESIENSHKDKASALAHIAGVLRNKSAPKEQQIFPGTYICFDGPVFELFYEQSIRYRIFLANNVDLKSTLPLERELVRISNTKTDDEKSVGSLCAQKNKLLKQISEMKIAWRKSLIEAYNDSYLDDFSKKIKSIDSEKEEEVANLLLALCVLEAYGVDKFYILADPSSQKDIFADNPFKNQKKASAINEKLLKLQDPLFYYLTGLHFTRRENKNPVLYNIGLEYMKKSCERGFPESRAFFNDKKKPFGQM